MAINYAESYQQALANAFPKALHFGALWRTDNASRYKKIDAKTVKIPVLDVTGRIDGNRSKITGPSVRHSLDWETKTLTQHRTWDTLVHPVDVNQTNMVLTITQITKTYNEQQKFKEMDCYTASKLYSNFIAQGGKANTKALTTDNVLAYIDAVMEAMDEAFVPVSGRILYVTPHINTLIKNAKNLSRVLGATESAIKRSIERVDELSIESVPSTLMKTLYDFTVGAEPAAAAEQIDMMFLHPDAVLPISTYATAMLSEPTALSEGKWVYFEEAFEDIFILNRRKDALAFHVTASSDETTGGSDE